MTDWLLIDMITLVLSNDWQNIFNRDSSVIFAASRHKFGPGSASRLQSYPGKILIPMLMFIQRAYIWISEFFCCEDKNMVSRKITKKRTYQFLIDEISHDGKKQCMPEFWTLFYCKNWANWMWLNVAILSHSYSNEICT
jgi:hypothetical protein